MYLCKKITDNIKIFKLRTQLKGKLKIKIKTINSGGHRAGRLATCQPPDTVGIDSTYGRTGNIGCTVYFYPCVLYVLWRYNRCLMNVGSLINIWNILGWWRWWWWWYPHNININLGLSWKGRGGGSRTIISLFHIIHLAHIFYNRFILPVQNTFSSFILSLVASHPNFTLHLHSLIFHLQIVIHTSSYSHTHLNTLSTPPLLAIHLHPLTRSLILTPYLHTLTVHILLLITPSSSHHTPSSSYFIPSSYHHMPASAHNILRPLTRHLHPFTIHRHFSLYTFIL